MVVKIKALPGCITQANQWEEIRPMIEDTKQLWLETALEYDHHIPEPEPLPASQ